MVIELGKAQKVEKLNLDMSIGLISKYCLWTDTLIIVFSIFLIHIPIDDMCLSFMGQLC